MSELLKNLKADGHIIEKWENHGFLTTAKNKRNVALACELSALCMIDNDKYVGEITTLTHPAMVRIFRNQEDDLLIKTILDNVIEIIQNLSQKLSEIKGTDEWINRGDNVENDVEGEFLCKFCDDYQLNLV